MTPLPRLVPRPRVALSLLVLAATIFTVLALLVHDASDNRVDHAVLVRIEAHVPQRLIAAALHLADPGLIVVLFLGIVAWAVRRRNWGAVALAVVVPAAGVLLTEHVFKPWVNRTDTGYFAFPSGHESGVASFACVAAVLLLASRARPGVKIAGLALLAAHVALAAVGLVGSDWHYATDTVGSLALCACVTVVAALAVDSVSGSRRPGAAPEPPPHVHPEVSSGSPARATL